MLALSQAHTPDPEMVRRMFGRIASRYDLLNRLLSLGQYRRWQQEAVRAAAPPPGGRALDVCCGTGKVAADLARMVGSSGTVVGVDFAMPMLRLAMQRPVRDGSCMPWYLCADAHGLPFEDSSFDCAIIAFGIRNVASPDSVLREMARVLVPGGRLVCLEFGLPDRGAERALVRAYEWLVIPIVGGTLSRREAYQYLASSIASFMSPEQLASAMRAAGLTGVETRAMHLGSVYLHRGVRP